MPNPFVWYELMTTDVEAAKAFYGSVIGWKSMPAPAGGGMYHLFTQGEEMVAGVMAATEEAKAKGARPGWLGYVEAPVDATVAAAQAKGAGLYHPPTDIPGVGRFAVMADPQQAALGLIQWEQPMTPPTLGAPGRVGWHELLAQDWQAAFGFYSGLFGWEKGDAVDIGPMGTYQLFTAGAGPIGGMFDKPAAVPAVFWLYYFAVPDFDAAVDRAKAGGAHVVNGPMQVPGGDWIVQALDPQGAMFALVGRR